MTAARSAVPFTQWTDRVVPDPADSALVDDGFVLWALATRLELRLEVAGSAIDTSTPPTAYDVMALATAGGQVSLAEVATHPRGAVFDVAPQVVQPGRSSARFTVFPPDVARELIAFGERPAAPAGYPYRLLVRRTRDAINSLGPGLPWVAGRNPTNPLGVHPDDLAQLGCESGARLTVRTAHGAVEAVAEADDTLRPGVVSLSHAWGEKAGADVNALLSADDGCEDINGMPWMTAVPVALEAHRLRDDADLSN